MILNQKIDQIKLEGIPFSYLNNQTKVFPLLSSASPELAFNIIRFDPEKNIDDAFRHGRAGSFFTRLKERINLSLKKKKFPVYFTIDEKETNKILHENFSQFENPGTDAKLIYENNKFSIQKETYGQKIDYQAGLHKLEQNLTVLDNSEIKLYAEIDKPQILLEDAQGKEEKAEKILEGAPFLLTLKDNQWWISKDDLADWITLKRNNSFSILKEKIIVGLDHEKITQYLEENVAPNVNIEPIEAKFEIKDGKVVEFQNSRDGFGVNIESSIKKIEYELIEGCVANPSETCGDQKDKIELATHELKSTVRTEEINDLGIKEIIGTGHSNFAGSPKNRRHNIATGAEAVNGTLIKPDEEFSLIETLGDITAETGYLPELVIKGDETIPEYGGGLCQVGTTMFRATTASGMPVTLRRNHSYRVSYYEPAGTDATIYDPWPDYRFLNDSPYHILIQSRIEGDDLYFDFWSTEDGRIASSSQPVIYNITKPKPTKIVETLNLPPGEKKCTESSHNGADAYFDYNVTYPNGEVKEERFTSHYVPWRAVCLLGVEKLSASSTEEVVEEPVAE
jgi:vancomycin resistance protein YoaR